MPFLTFLKDSIGFLSDSRVSFFVLSPIKKHQVFLVLPSDFRALVLEQFCKLLKQ